MNTKPDSIGHALAHDIKNRSFVEHCELPACTLARLFKVAAKALHAEDRGLHAALEMQNSVRRHQLSCGLGLTYWVYETTLVYTIWKAWLPEIEVNWEVKSNATKRGTKKKTQWFDLQLYDGAVERHVEAKWWNTKVNGVVSDINRLEEVNAKSGLMLTFWWGIDVEADLRDAEKKLTQIHPGWKLAYAAAFRADSWYARNQKAQGYFAMVAWMPAKDRAFNKQTTSRGR
jgi:hypothetical protein